MNRSATEDIKVHSTRRSARARRGGVVLAAVWMGMLVGCEGTGGRSTSAPTYAAADQYGRTYYIDGAGNWGYGVADIRDGLTAAGYRGNVLNYRWSPYFNPALDQTVGRPVARAKGVALAREINAYHQRFPDADVNIIALSAGTGVAVWACEAIEPPAHVHTLILLGSSLSGDYDMALAMKHIKGRVYVYYSSGDLILQGPVRTLGTIDGKLAVDAAGISGLKDAARFPGRIINIGWRRQYEALGWTGAHTDATSKPFVQQELARRLQEPAAVTSQRPTRTAGRNL